MGQRQSCTICGKPAVKRLVIITPKIFAQKDETLATSLAQQFRTKWRFVMDYGWDDKGFWQPAPINKFIQRHYSYHCENHPFFNPTSKINNKWKITLDSSCHTQ